MVDKFMEFVQEQSAHASHNIAGELSIEADKQRWLDHLDGLKTFVDNALAIYAQAGIKTSIRMVWISEEQTGKYEAPQIEISVGQASVKLKPIGTFLIGAFGRVDMEGPRGICRLMLVPRKAQTPSFAFGAQEHVPGDEPWRDLVWKIVPAPPARNFVELAVPVFLEMLMKVVRGG